MALLGGGVGGAGNPVGGSFTGPAEALEYIGVHAYAASGQVEDDAGGAAVTTLLDFQMGSGYLVGRIDFQDSTTGATDVYFQLSFNGQVVIASKESTAASYQPQSFHIIIPPYTEVVAKWGVGAGAFQGNCFITGRVYRD